MNGDMRQLIAKVASLMKGEYGFSKKGRLLIREDKLLRVVAFQPEKTAMEGCYRFDVTLSLGLPGLSSVTSSRREWVVSASLSKLYRLRNPGVGRFELTGDRSGDEEVEAAVLALLSDLCDEFFLSVGEPVDLLALITDDLAESKRLDLWPWNELPRLELASAYSAFLGLGDRARALQDQAIRGAIDGGMEYAVERVQKGVKHALAARERVCGST
ncbi:hypothetical protein E1265_34950 [Streptomyces sp. 8K308]|uniref:hypothetical protein n=1 Tax=Streptomyces sp. 8K308 TaxID=2530388 RepID=UPI001051285B|nr:hypothetical protein [Streptomyces sp. 8K308]TDC06139.1 hypothetical protein E1265_34950 [Streptomyces sp. 8K308]